MVVPSDGRTLVDLETHTVAQRMSELLAVALVPDEPPSGPIDLGERCPRTNGCQTPLLGLSHNLINLLKPAMYGTKMEDSCQVGIV